MNNGNQFTNNGNTQNEYQQPAYNPYPTPKAKRRKMSGNTKKYVAWIIVISVFMIFFTTLFIATYLSDNRCTAETEGTATTIYVVKDKKTGVPERYEGSGTYTVNGEKYEFHFSNSEAKSYDQKVKIRYNPDNPKEYSIGSKSKGWDIMIFVIMFLVLGGGVYGIVRLIWEIKYERRAASIRAGSADVAVNGGSTAFKNGMPTANAQNDNRPTFTANPGGNGQNDK